MVEHPQALRDTSWAHRLASNGPRWFPLYGSVVVRYCPARGPFWFVACRLSGVLADGFFSAVPSPSTSDQLGPAPPCPGPHAPTLPPWLRRASYPVPYPSHSLPPSTHPSRALKFSHWFAHRKRAPLFRTDAPYSPQPAPVPLPDAAQERL